MELAKDDFRPNADADQHFVKGRALARASERSEANGLNQLLCMFY